MANIYLIPKGVYRMGVEATINDVRMNFSALFFEFNEKFSDLVSDRTTDIIPSYDGSHAGLLEPYEYTIIAGSSLTPVVNGRCVIKSKVDSSKDVVLYLRPSTICINLAGRSDDRYFIESYYGYNPYPYKTVGIMVAHFSDNVYSVDFVENEINPSWPSYPNFTYLAPSVTLDHGNWGYCIANVDASTGYAPFTGSFRISPNAQSDNVYLVAGDTIVGRSYKLSTDPYDNFPEPEDTGGGGVPSGDGDDIDIPATPAISAGTSGLVTLYNPTISQLRSLASYLWSGPFDLESFKKIFADPMDCILGLSIVPVSVPNGTIQPITVGNISTGIAVSTAAADYVEVDCGTLNIPHEFYSFLDYAPFTTVDIYLPYIGVRHLDTDNIMPAGGEDVRTVKVVYKVDLFTGGCIAFIKCGSSVMYSFAGQCATQIPVTGNSWTELYKSIAGIATSLVGSISVGGAGGDAMSKYGDNFHSRSTLSSNVSHSSSMSASSVADVVFSAKPQVDRTGSLGSAIGLLGIQKPYLIIRRPVLCIPKYMNLYSPYPSYQIHKISDLSGHAEFEEVHLEHVPATENEIEEIYSLLRSGVII